MGKNAVQAETKRLVLRTLTPDDAPLLSGFVRKNRIFFAAWEPDREAEFFLEETQRKTIEDDNEAFQQKRILKMYLFPKGENRIIGQIGATNIVYGPFLSCFLGYKMDEIEQGKGYMSEALGTFVEVLFRDYGLHRIEANIMPQNERSIRLVRHLGFELEGGSPKYLAIRGTWEDHEHYVLRNLAMEEAFEGG